MELKKKTKQNWMRARKQRTQEINPEGQGCSKHREKPVQIKEGGGRPL